MKVIIVHGFKSKPNGSWRPWLMNELQKHDVYSCAIPLPNPQYPDKDEWVQAIQNTLDMFPEEEYVLVGHSLGVIAILNLLSNKDSIGNIRGSILVSGPVEKLHLDEPEHMVRQLDGFFGGLDFDCIQKNSKDITVIHGENDAKVPFSHAEKLSETVSGKLIRVKNGGHLSSYEGVFELPEVLDEVLKITNLKPNT